MKRSCLRLVLMVLCLTLITVSLSACAPSLSDSAIKDMLAENADNFMPNSDEDISSIEITKRSVNKEARAEEVWFVVNSTDSEAEYIRYFIAGFKLYDKGGWQYELAAADPSEKPSATPIAGVNDDTVKEIINTQGLKTPIAIGDDNWTVNTSSIKSITVGAHDTQLASKTDIVTVAIVLEDIVQKAEGEVQLTFKYDDGWQYDEYTISKPFTASAIAGTEKELTSAGFVDLLISQDSFYFGNQDVRLVSDEVTDVTLVSSSVTSKGTYQSYEYSFNVNKAQGRLVLATTAKVEYQYSDGWQTPTLTFTDIKLSSLDLTGTWAGTGKGSGIHAAWFDQRSVGVSFEIAEKGTTLENVTVTLNQPNAEAFMRVIIDPNNLKATLAFTEWTQEPFDVERLNGLPTLSGSLNIDDFSILINNGELYDLRLTQSQEANQ